MPQAASLAAELKKRFHTDAELIQGGGGDFIITVDRKKIFSKKEIGRFPEHEEIVEAIQGLR